MRIRPRFILGLVVVFVIVPLIVSLFTPFRGGPGSEKRLRVGNDIVNVALALQAFHAAYGQYPTNDDTAGILGSLSGSNPAQKVFLNYNRSLTQSNNDFLDPWGIPYVIVADNRTNFMIKSAGRNKSFGDKDDWLFDLAKDAFTQVPEK